MTPASPPEQPTDAALQAKVDALVAALERIASVDQLCTHLSRYYPEQELTERCRIAREALTKHGGRS